MEKNEVPFFARFLEGQEFPRVTSEIKAGPGWPPVQTMKYPSDTDDDPVIIPWP